MRPIRQPVVSRMARPAATRYNMRAVDMINPSSRLRTHAFQFSGRTTQTPDEILDGLAARRLPGIVVDERGPNYIVLRPQRHVRYGGDVAVIAGILIVFAVLILTAVTPVFIALLPMAILPAIPPLLDHRPDIAFSAVGEDDPGGTRVTVHGQASPELAAALDAYLGSLPRYVPVDTGVPGERAATEEGSPPPRPPAPHASTSG